MADDVAYKGQKKGFGSRVRDCGNSIWNGQKKELFGRTAGSWAKIGLFYLIFYSCLAGFFAAMMAGFFQTLDDKVPSMTGMYSLIKQNPGMGYRPMVHIESTLIKFNNKSNETFVDQIENIANFLKENGYLDSETGNPAPEEPGLSFSVGNITQCQYDTSDRNISYGYLQAEPCVLLKLNRVYGWGPELFTNEDNETEAYQDALKAMNVTSLKPGYIGVSCEGENDGDIDNLGEVEFYPPDGFDATYYPYLNQDNYRPPIVFAKFSNAKKGVIIQIWCKAWAKNIKHHKNDKAGSVHFELLIDAPQS